MVCAARPQLPDRSDGWYVRHGRSCPTGATIVFGGSPLTVRNALWRPTGCRGRVPRLYLAGENTFPGPGTLSSALSGLYASRAMIKEYPPD